MKKSCLRWDTNPRSLDQVADALPAEPRLLLLSWYIIAECDRSAAMRFTANKIVAVSASAVTAAAAAAAAAAG